MVENSKLQTVYKGRHLSMVKRGRWEYTTRNTRRPAVGIVAITAEGKVVVVEQFRPPVGQSVFELPAGLSGDVVGAESESLIEAAKRELWEETGYTAKEWTELGSGFSSPGLTDESIVLFLARRLEKTGPGGGDDNEDIKVHEIPVGEVSDWLYEKEVQVDLKLFAGLYAAQSHWEELRTSNE